MKTWHLNLFLIVLIFSWIVITSDFITSGPFEEQQTIGGKAAYAEEILGEQAEQENSSTAYEKPEDINSLDNPAEEMPDNEGIAYIEIKDFQFVPRELTVDINTTVIWINNDSTGSHKGSYVRPHMVVSATNLFRSPQLSSGEEFSFTFTEAGSYKYLDPIYRSEQGGVSIVPGIITVE